MSNCVQTAVNPVFFVGLALYFEFFNVRAYGDGTTECLFLDVPNNRCEEETEMTNGRREGLQGGCNRNAA